MRNKRYKFLTESVLFEESGLPRINIFIICVVAAIVVMFLVWANFVIMEDTIQLKGVLNQEDSSFRVLGQVTTSNVALVHEDAEVFISIPGITGRKDMHGEIVNIINEPQYDQDNRVYYLINIKINMTNSEKETIYTQLLEGMECNLEVVSGTRTMLQYLLGNLYDTGRSTFNFK